MRMKIVHIVFNVFQKLLFVILALILFLAFQESKGQAVNFTASATKHYGVGDHIRVSCDVNDEESS